MGDISADWYRPGHICDGKSQFSQVVDIAAPTLALGLGIVRIGCFLYGCDYGTVQESSISLHFPQWDDPGVAEWIRGNAPAFDAHMRNGTAIEGVISGLFFQLN